MFPVSDRLTFSDSTQLIYWTTIILWNTGRLPNAFVVFGLVCASHVCFDLFSYDRRIRRIERKIPGDWGLATLRRTLQRFKPDEHLQIPILILHNEFP